MLWAFEPREGRLGLGERIRRVDDGAPRTGLEPAQETREVVGTAHHRPQDRLLGEVERSHLEPDVGAAGAAEDDEAPAAAAQALQRLLPGRADRVENDVGAA